MRTRRLWNALALLISLWVLFPIYLIALSAFSDEAEISAWPKAFLPVDFSLETIAFFLESGSAPSAMVIEKTAGMATGIEATSSTRTNCRMWSASSQRQSWATTRSR